MDDEDECGGDVVMVGGGSVCLSAGRIKTADAKGGRDLRFGDLYLREPPAWEPEVGNAVSIYGLACSSESFGARDMGGPADEKTPLFFFFLGFPRPKEICPSPVREDC